MLENRSTGYNRLSNALRMVALLRAHKEHEGPSKRHERETARIAREYCELLQNVGSL